MNSGEVRDALEVIVRSIAGSRQALADSIRLYHDLEISGDDAFELVNMVAKKYGTNFTGFQYSSYFPNEGDSLVTVLCRRLGFPGQFKSFTFGHLVETVLAGAWFEPQIADTTDGRRP